jgi:hypothetical protein
VSVFIWIQTLKYVGASFLLCRGKIVGDIGIPRWVTHVPSTWTYTDFFFHWLYSPLGPWPLIFNFMTILLTVGLLERGISSSQGLHLNTEQHKHRINTYTYQTSMPCLRFEPTIPASEWAKTVHALDLPTTVIGMYKICWGKLRGRNKLIKYRIVKMYGRVEIELHHS